MWDFACVCCLNFVFIWFGYDFGNDLLFFFWDTFFIEKKKKKNEKQKRSATNFKQTQ